MNRNLRRWTIVTLLVAVVAGIPLTHASTPDQTATGVTVTPLADLLGDVASFAGIQSAAISPDGTTIAWYERSESDESAGGRLCLYSLANSQADCYPHGNENQISGLHWSPDSRYIAFNEEFPRYFLEPDIWVFDRTTGTVTNFTDDGVSRGSFVFDAETREAAQIDMLPVWNPAQPGQLYFFRTILGEERDSVALYSLQAETGAVELVYDLGSTFPRLSIYDIGSARSQALEGRAAISPDGRQLAFTVTGSDLEDRHNGAWLLDLTGEEPLKLLFPVRYTQQGMPDWSGEYRWYLSGVAWLPGTSQLLVFAQGPGIEGIPLSNIWRVDTAARDVEPLLDFTGMESLTASLQSDDTGYTLISYAPLMPLLVGDTLVTTALNQPGAETGRIVLRAFDDLPESSASDVIHEFGDVTLSNMLTGSASTGGKAILDGYLIDLDG